MALTEKQITETVEKIVHGAQERYVRELTNSLIDDLMDGFFSSTDAAKLETLAKISREHAEQVLLQNRGLINEEVMRTVTDVLMEADAADVAALTAYYGTNALVMTRGTVRAHEMATQTARGLSEIIRRQNIALASQAEQIWYKVAGEAITAKNLGVGSMDKIITDAVSQLTQAGITTIDYKSGISNNVDVAIRRHLVTQLSQSGGEMTLARLDDYGHELILTSAHYGARPTHAEWQGKPTCRGGAKIVDGVSYPEFEIFTGYGTVTGLKGVNCRHSFGPYFPGITELPDLSFPTETEHFGMSSEDYYNATQRQRELERRIRATKREIAGMERAGLGLSSPSYVQKRLLLGKQQGMMAAHVKEHRLLRQVRREKAYGIGAQPIALRSQNRWRPIIQIGRSLGAAAFRDTVRLPNGSYTKITEGSKITGIKIIAGKGSSDKINDIEKLIERNGGKRADWSKMRGNGYVDDLGMSRAAELHWYQEDSVGRVEMKVKRFYY